MATTDTPSGGATGGSDEQSRAALVGTVAGLALLPWLFGTLIVVGTYADNRVPGIDDPDRDFVRFYTDNFSKIRVTATLDVIASVLVLVFLVSLVRAASRRVDLVGILAITLAGASTAVAVAGRGLFAGPTLVMYATDTKVARTLDPDVARLLLTTGDTMGAVAGVLFGFALAATGVLVLRSDLAGRRFLTVTAGLLAVLGVCNLVLGGGGGMLIVLGPWALVTAILLVVSRARWRTR